MAFSSGKFKSYWLKAKKILCLGGDPDFFILGAQKCGTTSIFNYILSAGDNFKPPVDKELYFFSEKFHLGLDFYRSMFPSVKLGSNITGEATPDYLFYHKSPELLSEFYPVVKLVVVLRDPIDRAFSQYNHQNFTRRTNAYDPFLFGDAIRKEEGRYSVQEGSSFFYEYKYFSYKKRGLYVEQIERWLQFFDRNNFLFLDISDLENPDKLKELFLFLGVKDASLSSVGFPGRHNENSSFTLCDQDRAYLERFFKGKFNDLERITGRSYPWLSKYL